MAAEGACQISRRTVAGREERGVEARKGEQRQKREDREEEEEEASEVMK